MKALFLYPSEMRTEYEDVKKGLRPTDRMYGLVELANAGFEVEFNDDRFLGKYGELTRWFRKYGIFLYDLKTLLSIHKYDIIIAKDNFSTQLSIYCKLFNKPLIYVDALFLMPNMYIKKKFFYPLNFKLAKGIVVYSNTQKHLWEKVYKTSYGKLKYLPYSIDADFYKFRDNSSYSSSHSEDYILSVGRDPGRDFQTLLAAAEKTGVKVKLITTPRNVPGDYQDADFVTIYNNLSYDELFDLYKRAKLVVIPLKSDISYPSGIRGVLEALSLGMPTIIGDTPVMNEFFHEGEVVTYEPGNTEDLISKINEYFNNNKKLDSLSENARNAIAARFDLKKNIQLYIDYFREIIK